MKKFIMCIFVVIMIPLSSAIAKRNVVEFEGHKIRFPRNMYHRMYEKDIKEKKSPSQPMRAWPAWTMPEKEVVDPIFDLEETVPIPLYYDSIKFNELRNLA